MIRAAQFLLLFSLLWGANAHAISLSQVEGIRLSADDISRDYEERTLVLEGSVEIAFDDQVLKCDKATIYQKESRIVATGNVLLASKDTVVEGTKIDFNYKTRLGKIENGIVQSGQVAFEGKTLEKTGPQSYFGKEARYTSCNTCPAGWSFSGQEIDAEIGGYAYIKYPVLRIADFPIFILPRILIPLKSDRQSGLLVPSMELSKRAGASFSQSYFWAISKSKDATFTLQQSGKRGLKSLLEYRYVLGPGSSGTFRGAYIQDKLFIVDTNPTDGAEELEIPRGYFQYRHLYELPDNITQRMQMTYLTDIRYPRDFSDELSGHGDPALESNMSVTQNTETQSRSIEGAFYVNLLKNFDPSDDTFTPGDKNGDALSRNDDAVHRWPEVRWNFTDRPVGDSNLLFGMDFNYVHFIRRDFSYDDIQTTCTGAGGKDNEAGAGKCNDPARDGTFDADDLIRTGHRTIIEPKLTYPFRIGKNITATPSVKYHEAQYRFTANNEPTSTNPTGYSQNAERRFLQTDVNLQTEFSAIYGPDDGKSSRFKHVIIPEIAFTNIPWAETPEGHPFFGDFEDQPYSRRNEAVSTNDFFDKSRLQFDYKDRFFETEVYIFRLTNNWVRKTLVGNEWMYRKIVALKLQQGYDAIEARRRNKANGQRPQPWLPVNMQLDVRLDGFETHTNADFYGYANGLLNWDTRIRFIGDYGGYAELTYAEKESVDANNVRSNKKENAGLGVGFQSKYADFTGKVNFNVLSSEFDSWDYVVDFKPPGDCWTIKLGHKQESGADDSYKFSINFEFGGV